jgi:RNA polymerase sigma-70 factor (ECF subfamily)
MSSEASQVLSVISRGDSSQTPQLMDIVYDDFRRLARKYISQQQPTQSIDPTVVVHEAYLKLVKQDGADWRGRSHFFAVGAIAMRQIISDHARRRATAKRGGGRTHISLDEKLVLSAGRDEDVLALEEALEALAKISEPRAKIVELLFYGGLSLDEIAEVTGTPRRTLQRRWAATRMWLRRRLSEGP